MIYLIAVYVLFVAALTAAEYKEKQSWQAVFKPLAALLFILIALLGGALYHDFGRWILYGLIACAVGDVLLLSRNKPVLFQFGMAAFAVGHICYVYALFSHGQTHWWILGLLISATSIFFVFRYLKPHLPKDMSGPVALYMVIISAMVTVAVGTGKLMLMLPAKMFAVSDVFVARDRFFKTVPRNALWITPLYFGAQLLFAHAAWI